MKVTVHNDSFPDDEAFEVPGLGLVVNHEAKEVTQEQVAAYESWGYKWPDKGDLILDQNPPPESIADTNTEGDDDE